MALESVPCKPCQVGKGFRSVYLAGLVQLDCNFHVCMSFFGLQCNLRYLWYSVVGGYILLQFLGWKHHISPQLRGALASMGDTSGSLKLVFMTKEKLVRKVVPHREVAKKVAPRAPTMEIVKVEDLNQMIPTCIPHWYWLHDLCFIAWGRHHSVEPSRSSSGSGICRREVSKTGSSNVEGTSCVLLVIFVVSYSSGTCSMSLDFISVDISLHLTVAPFVSHSNLYEWWVMSVWHA